MRNLHEYFDIDLNEMFDTDEIGEITLDLIDLFYERLEENEGVSKSEYLETLDRDFDTVSGDFINFVNGALHKENKKDIDDTENIDIVAETEDKVLYIKKERYL